MGVKRSRFLENELTVLHRCRQFQRFQRLLAPQAFERRKKLVGSQITELFRVHRVKQRFELCVVHSFKGFLFHDLSSLSADKGEYAVSIKDSLPQPMPRRKCPFRWVKKACL